MTLYWSLIRAGLIIIALKITDLVMFMSWPELFPENTRIEQLILGGVIILVISVHEIRADLAKDNKND